MSRQNLIPWGKPYFTGKEGEYLLKALDSTWISGGEFVDKLVRDRFAENNNVRVFIRTGERGFATAIRHGIEKSSGNVIVVMDTDFNHTPKCYPR